MDRFIYPANLIPDTEDGGFIVRFVDFPEAITQGETIAEALSEATDCLEEAIANRIVTEMDIPHPTLASADQHNIPLTTSMSIKAALYLSLRETQTTEADLARRLNRTERDIRKLVDPHTQPDLDQIEDALAVMGRHLSVSVMTRQLEKALATHTTTPQIF